MEISIFEINKKQTKKPIQMNKQKLFDYKDKKKWLPEEKPNSNSDKENCYHEVDKN